MVQGGTTGPGTKSFQTPSPLRDKKQMQGWNSPGCGGQLHRCKSGRPGLPVRLLPGYYRQKSQRTASEEEQRGAETDQCGEGQVLFHHCPRPAQPLQRIPGFNPDDGGRYALPDRRWLDSDCCQYEKFSTQSLQLAGELARMVKDATGIDPFPSGALEPASASGGES